jgi:hypothetical protein
MSDTDNFDNKEKIDILLKSFFGVPSTSDQKDWSAEFVEKYNKGVNGADLFLDEIPDQPDFDTNGTVRTAAELGLQTTDFVNYSIDDSTNKSGCSIVDDSTGTIRRFKALILERCAGIGTDNFSWLKKVAGNNILFDSLQFNFKMYNDTAGNVVKPYEYFVQTEDSLDTLAGGAGQTIPSGLTGGNWVYDINSGILLFPDVGNLSSADAMFVIGNANKPVLTVYKYIGRKGISRLIEVGDGPPSITAKCFISGYSSSYIIFGASSSAINDIPDGIIAGMTFERPDSYSTMHTHTLTNDLSGVQAPPWTAQQIATHMGVTPKLALQIPAGTEVTFSLPSVKKKIYVDQTNNILYVNNNAGNWAQIGGSGGTAEGIEFSIDKNTTETMEITAKNEGIGSANILMEADGSIDISGDVVDISSTTSLSLNNITWPTSTSAQSSGGQFLKLNASGNSVLFSSLNFNTILSHGSSGPDNTNDGVDGDFFFRTDEKKIYGPKANGTWPTGVTLNGEDGNTILSGNADPLAANGNDGDFFFRTDTNTIFGPKNGTWPAGVSFDGEDGNTILSHGSSGPDNTNDGVDGDFFFRTDEKKIYGPKASGSWPGTGISLLGPPGKTILSHGSSGPDNTNDGVDGDFFFRTDEKKIYGPKAGGSWAGTGISLLGPTGTTGTIPGFVSGDAGYSLKVNSAGNALEWSEGGGGASVEVGTNRPATTTQGDLFYNTTDSKLEINIAADGVTANWKGAGGGGGGIDISGGSTEGTDISGAGTGSNDANLGTGRKEGDIIYDSSKNIFYEASRDKEDKPNGDLDGELAFKPLGYSFFRENFEGQPPGPSFFFFSLTPSSIQITWKNPPQFTSGVSNSNDPYDNASNGEFASTVNSNHNIYFPVVNRIMIQIYNKQTSTYEEWGTKRSPITSDTATSGGVNGLKDGYVICSKNYPIPPMGTASPNFGDTNGTFGRTTRVYELSNFANSIILYKKDSTPVNATIQSTLTANSKLVSALKDEAKKELEPSTSGYEIKLWLENQYDSGSMSENDFNVVTLQNDSNGDPINFLNVLPPGVPSGKINGGAPDVDTAFNNLGNVNAGDTFLEFIIRDPQQTTTTNSSYNSTINLVEIKFEYVNGNDIAPDNNDFKPLKKIYHDPTVISGSNIGRLTTSSSLPAATNLTDGVFPINRLNDYSTKRRYYYIKFNSDFLDITNNDIDEYFMIRVSYKNASNNTFGPSQRSGIWSIDKPLKPTINSVKMIDFKNMQITLNGLADINDVRTNGNNSGYGVFLRNIKFNVSYKYSDQASQTALTAFTKLEGATINSVASTSTAPGTPVFINTNDYDTTSGADNTHTYTFELPADYQDSTNTNPITYYFSAFVRNNLFATYSDESDQVSIQITKPDSSISLVLTPQTATTNYNNKIKATWTAPSDGNRGIVSAQANSGLPKLDKYTFESATIRQVNNNNTVGHSNTEIDSARNADPITYLMFTFYDTLKKTTTDSTTKDLDLKIREYNEYIKNYTEVSKTISATATKPEVVSIDSETSLSISNTSSKNTVTLNWTHPTDRGLNIDGNNIRNTILTYTIDISRHSTTNKYLDSNSSHTDTDYQTTTTQSDTTDDQTGTTDAVNDKTLTSDDDNSLLWPNSTYNYTIRATNSLDYQSDVQTTVGDFTTGVPTIPTVFNYFNNSRLNSLRNTYELKNNNNYSNLGVLVSAGVSSSTTYSGTAVQITNYNNLSDITSGTVTHVLNKKHLQNFNTPLSNSNVQTWSSSVPTTANQAGFKIVNAANNDVELYTRGMSTNHTTETDDFTLFEVLRTNRKDIYSETYDDRNRGYWLKESIQYKINLATESNLTNYLYKPLRLELKSYYNTDGSDPAISSTQTGETVILQNSYSTNTNDNVYLDSLNSNPSIVKNGSSNMITYTPSNQINGIPNLARGGTIDLEYKLSNYSEYYLLQNSKNVAEHYFSYATSSANSVISWSSKAGGTRNSDHWIISKTLSSIPVTNTATTGITIKIRGRNTKGQTDLTIGSSHSSVINFIYDKPSSDEFVLITSTNSYLMEVPNSFDPIFSSTTPSGKNSTQPSNYSSLGNTTNNLQLPMFNGYFYSNYGWQQVTGISNSNNNNYGIGSGSPFIDINSSNYRYVIFKYTKTMGDGNLDRCLVALGGESSSAAPEINISDLRNDDIGIYLYYNQLVNSNGYYWYNIGKANAGATTASANAQGITYTGSLADAGYGTGSSGMTNSVFINGTGTNSITVATKNFTSTGAFSGSMPKRLLGAYLNRIDHSSGDILTFYIAFKIKNSINRRIKMPDFYVANSNTSVTKFN